MTQHNLIRLQQRYNKVRNKKIEDGEMDGDGEGERGGEGDTKIIEDITTLIPIMLRIFAGEPPASQENR